MSDDERDQPGPGSPEAAGPPASQPRPPEPQWPHTEPVAPAAAPPPPPPPPRTAYAPVAGVQVPGAYAQPPGGPMPVGPVRRRRSTGWVILVVLVLVAVTVMIGTFLSSQMSGGGEATLPGTSQVGVITITGVIKDGGRGGMFAGPPGARAIMAEVRQAKKDSDVKSVLLLIDSPGGSPAASDAVWQEVMALKKTKKVVVCMTDVCASGGYYIASAADKIVAGGSTLTGSIGVIFGGIGYSGLMQKLGLTDQTLTAGKYKDIGSPERPMTPDEKQYLTNLLQDVYGQFIHAVATGRNLPEDKVRSLAEGRIYTGKQALAVGLVDQLGDFYDAAKLAGTLGGIRGEPKLKYYGESKGFFADLASSDVFKHAFGSRSAFDEMPLNGPMLVMPYTYQMVPAFSGTVFDFK